MQYRLLSGHFIISLYTLGVQSKILILVQLLFQTEELALVKLLKGLCMQSVRGIITKTFILSIHRMVMELILMHRLDKWLIQRNQLKTMDLSSFQWRLKQAQVITQYLLKQQEPLEASLYQYLMLLILGTRLKK